MNIITRFIDSSVVYILDVYIQNVYILAFFSITCFEEDFFFFNDLLEETEGFFDSEHFKDFFFVFKRHNISENIWEKG